ncbi:MAG: N-acetylneuraminate synthase [Flavobacteriales bacterium]|nr:N-acetylneuraminate synthase [Flavobacteriales bacterium]
MRTTIIAEAGVNHNGDLSLAKRLIDVAAEAGADIVKFQSFKAEFNIAADAPKAAYQERNTGSAESQLEMVRSLELSEADHDALIAHCAVRGIAFLSTPFDAESIALLKRKGITIGKIPSGEITNKPHLQAMARAFPHLIISTGMCTLAEVRAALDVLLHTGADKQRITLLHCNTEYPTPMADVNLRAMGSMREAFGLPVGYSDHTLGIEVPIAAVALGATIIEKHITLDRSMPGPDHRASLEPAELKAMVQAIRNIEAALGTADKQPSPSETKNIAIARKSIHISRPVAKGEQIAADDLIMLRPGDGIPPMRIDEVIGMRTTRDLSKGTKLQEQDLQ